MEWNIHRLDQTIERTTRRNSIKHFLRDKFVILAKQFESENGEKIAKGQKRECFSHPRITIHDSRTNERKQASKQESFEDSVSVSCVRCNERWKRWQQRGKKEERNYHYLLLIKQKRESKTGELMCVTSLCCNLAFASNHTAKRYFPCITSLKRLPPIYVPTPLCFRPLPVNFQIFVLHYILSSWMEEAFKQRKMKNRFLDENELFLFDQWMCGKYL